MWNRTSYILSELVQASTIWSTLDEINSCAIMIELQLTRKTVMVELQETWETNITFLGLLRAVFSLARQLGHVG